MQRIGNRCLRCFPSSAADGFQCVPAQWRWALRAANCAPFRVAVMRLRPLVPVAGGGAPDCALRLPVACGLEWGGLKGVSNEGREPRHARAQPGVPPAPWQGPERE